METIKKLIGIFASACLSPSPQPELTGSPGPGAPPPPHTPGPIANLPSESLDRIFELVAEPIALRSGWWNAREAANTLFAASLVSKRWQDLASRALEQNCCITLPFQIHQLKSYDSRPRLPCTSMALRLNSDRNTREVGVRIEQALARFKGVRSLDLYYEGVIMQEILNFSAFSGLSALNVSSNPDFEYDTYPTMGTISLHTMYRLQVIEIDNNTPGWPSAAVFESAKESLVDVKISRSGWGLALRFLPVDFKAPNLRSITFKAEGGSAPGRDVASLASFPSLRTLKFNAFPFILTDRDDYSYALFDSSPHLFESILGTLLPPYNLTQLSLPIGIPNLQPICTFLGHKALDNLHELLLPNLPREFMGQRGLGRELLGACEERGIRVVFREELVVLRALR